MTPVAGARETGQGEFIDISLLDSQLATLAYQASNYLVSGDNPDLSGNAHPNIVPYQVFDTADDPVVVAVGNDAQFVSLCGVIACKDLGVDPRFKNNSDRVLNRRALVPLIATELEKKKAAFWLSEFESSGIPAGPVNSIGEAFADPHVIERETVIQMQRTDLGAVPSVRSPIRFRNCEAEISKAAPALGDSTGSVLRELGLTDDEIKTLLNDGVITKATE